MGGEAFSAAMRCARLRLLKLQRGAQQDDGTHSMGHGGAAMNLPFADRRSAGRALAHRLMQLKLQAPVVVLALPRGGVPVAAEVARVLSAALDLVLVRKIGAPWQPEFAVGAVAEGDPPQIVVDPAIKAMVGVEAAYIDEQARVGLREIARRRQVYLRGRSREPVEGCTAVVVDDGIATGATMRAALKAVRARRPARLVLAVPVAPSDTLAELSSEVDVVVCLEEPRPFESVGRHYVDFGQVDDDEVVATLEAARS
jgi:putative phosphoribosyl transferase